MTNYFKCECEKPYSVRGKRGKSIC